MADTKQNHVESEINRDQETPLPPRYGGEFRGRKIYGRLAQITCFTLNRKDRYQSSYRCTSGLSDSGFVTMTIP